MNQKSKIGSPETLVARFWAKVQRGPGCWLWTGARLHGGYGQIDKRGAHRVSLEIAQGPLPPGALVCHRCDNPRCVRPDHLFVGTSQDNTTDMIRKGRNVRGSAVCTAKLTSEQVADIRERHARGASQASLARAFGVGQPHISSIVRNVAWRHDAAPNTIPPHEAPRRARKTKEAP